MCLTCQFIGVVTKYTTISLQLRHLNLLQNNFLGDFTDNLPYNAADFRH